MESVSDLKIRNVISARRKLFDEILEGNSDLNSQLVVLDIIKSTRTFLNSNKFKTTVKLDLTNESRKLFKIDLGNP